MYVCVYLVARLCKQWRSHLARFGRCRLPLQLIYFTRKGAESRARLLLPVASVYRL